MSPKASVCAGQTNPIKPHIQSPVCLPNWLSPVCPDRQFTLNISMIESRRRDSPASCLTCFNLQDLTCRISWFLPQSLGIPRSFATAPVRPQAPKMIRPPRKFGVDGSSNFVFILFWEDDCLSILIFSDWRLSINSY